jgi:hypothetical protein
MPADPGTASIERECRALVRYLVGQDPPAYVVDRYRAARGSAAPAGERLAPIDRALLGATRLGSTLARLADGYARVARPTGPLRRRLTLAVAILECAPPSHLRLNAAAVGSRPALALRLGTALVASGLALVLGVAGFGLIHLLTAPFGGGAPGAGRSR